MILGPSSRRRVPHFRPLTWHDAAMVIAILQARMTSTRLPGKVMRPILGAPMIGRQIERISRARLVEKLVVATSAEPSDDRLASYCRGIGVAIYRGDLADVLSRFAGAVAAHGPAQHVVRLTADCPLTDWEVIDSCIHLHLAGGHDFTSNSMRRSFPIGLDVEVMTAELLDRLATASTTAFQREHVTQLVYDQPAAFDCGHYVQDRDESARRWTVDTPADFTMVEAVYSALYPGNRAFTTQDVRAFLAAHPDIAALNNA
jgi:spore coat polysaccharide biosynthesis protein SpsF